MAGARGKDKVLVIDHVEKADPELRGQNDRLKNAIRNTFLDARFRGNDLWPPLRAAFSHRRKGVSGRIFDIKENPL